MDSIGKLVMIAGFCLVAWSAYQYYSNEPTKISKPTNFFDGVRAIQETYSNIADKPEKQKQAKDTAIIGGIVFVAGLFISSINRKKRPDEQIIQK